MRLQARWPAETTGSALEALPRRFRANDTAGCSVYYKIERKDADEQ